MTWSVVTPPAGEPVSLDAAKLHCRVDGDQEDALVTSLIQAAREHIEDVCERAIMPQVWAETRDRFDEEIELRGGKVRSVSSVTYADAGGEVQTLDPSGYLVDLTSSPPVVTAAYGTAWPEARRQRGSVVVTYAVGYDGVDDVPASLKAALLLYVGDLYANRSAQQGAELFANPVADRLIFPFRRVLP